MRIRSIKPEFFDSPSTAACTSWARLLYIAMWCMADDWGVGSANPKEMAADAFPNDDQWTPQELPSLCKEVADNFGVIFYTHRGRRYFQIPSWDDHQVTQRRAKRRFPAYDNPESVPDQEVPNLPSVRKELPSRDKENASTEQGNMEQGNMEQGTSADADTAPPEPQPVREDVAQICEAVALHAQDQTGKRPNVTKKWRDSARLLIDRDGYSLEQITWIIRWVHANDFWAANILSAPKLREKFPNLVAHAKRDGTPKVDKAAQMILADRMRRENDTNNTKEITQ